ncbi:mitochondrial antiviral-signaling protein isoform 2-T2 [Clarias gariepinus]|uniref:mitochondrial antiviral-signaling protein isoform X2 n=1 Tax=Clarias gariepinus TaxID=13013 RepID=UPI00234C8415|nr:mitochondrial antiviral-signaling protein isoform X2 [Clarias gariepinus]
MAYVGERLYDEFIRKNMANLASRVKVREIVPYLACLTNTDREEIEAKREIAGNYNAMTLLLDYLRRRENWPDQFISALRQCEHRTLANEISDIYDRIRGIPTPAPVPAAAAYTPAPFPAEAVGISTTATIHNAPTNPPLLTPSVDGPTQTANLSHISSPPRQCANIAASAIEAPALVSAPDAAVHVPPKSAQPAEPPLLVIESGPPGPISAPPLIYQSEVPVGVRETSKLVVSGHSAPVNSLPESCFNTDSPALAPAIVSAQDASVHISHGSAHPAEPPLLVVAPHAVPPSPVSAPDLIPFVGQSVVPVSCIETPTLGMSSDLKYIAKSGPTSVAVPTLPINATSTSSQTNKPSTTFSALPEKSKVAESSISVKHPIQDSSPPRIVIPQDSQNNQTNNQVVERVNTAAPPNFQIQETARGSAQASPSASPDTTAHCLDNLAAENEENFSKPAVLRGEEPCSVSSDLQISHRTTEHSPTQPVRLQALSNQNWADEPVEGSLSVTTDNLMISSSTTTVSTQLDSGPVAPVENSFHRAQGNASTEGDNIFCLNQPVEDHYESSSQSIQAEQETREHLVEFSERPSVQNLSGQPPSMVGPSTIGLKHNAETENLVQSVSLNETSQHKQTQCIQEHNSSEQVISAVEPVPATYPELELNNSGQINNPRSEQGEEFQGVLHRFRSYPHLIGAAGIGIIAVFLALRLKR